MTVMSFDQTLASHTMPDFFTPLLLTVMAVCAAPLLIACVLGAAIGDFPFRWKQLVGLVWGMIVGMITVAPFTVVAFILGMNLGNPGLVIGGALGCAAGSWTAYRSARLYRPDKPKEPDESPAPRLTSTGDESNPYLPPGHSYSPESSR